MKQLCVVLVLCAAVIGCQNGKSRKSTTTSTALGEDGLEAVMGDPAPASSPVVPSKSKAIVDAVAPSTRKASSKPKRRIAAPAPKSAPKSTRKASLPPAPGF